ncbi:MAG TPA: hypothetical protein VKQ30_23265 [Ktedonobacterales bacterium]|nr:hypothetical protein [Ktedonobacterales bacterium]
MTKDEAATLQRGDWLQYILSVESEPGGLGVVVERSISATYVKPTTNPFKVVIRPLYRVESRNRARVVSIHNLRKW